MDASGLFTVLAIFIAIVTLLSEERRIDFFIRLPFWYMLVFFLLNLSVFVIIYSQVLLHIPGVKSVPYVYGFDDKTVILGLVIAITIMFSVKFFGKKVPKSKYKMWESYASSLLREKKYRILSFLFLRYSDQFIKKLNEVGCYKKFYSFIYKNSQQSIDDLFRFPPINISVINKIKFSIFKFILGRLPVDFGSSVVLYRSISMVFKSKPFAIFLSESHPDAAKYTLCTKLAGCEEFTNTFLKALVSNVHGPLYRELRDNQNRTSQDGYYIDPANSILNFYFSNVENAVTVSVWKPIGDFVVDFIKSKCGDDSYYNSYSNGYFYEDEIWECPIFCGVTFFNVMVNRAIYSGVQDHMWLMYYDYFIIEIIKNLDRSKNNNCSSEFPLKFDYLIYCIISNCSDWIDSLNYVPHGSEFVALKYASKTFGSIVRKVIKSNKNSITQKVMYLEILLRTMKDIKVEDEYYSKLIFNSLVREEEWHAIDIDVSWLRDVYKQVDFMLKDNNSIFAKELLKI